LPQDYYDIANEVQQQAGVSELSGIPKLDQATVLEVAQKIYPFVEEWTQLYAVLRLKPIQRRLAATCLANAAMCPDAELTAIIASTKFSILMWLIDDLADNIIGSWTQPQVMAMLDLYDNIVASAGKLTYQDYQVELAVHFTQIDEEQLWVQLALAFTEFCQELTTFAAANTYYWFFRKRFHLMIKCFQLEESWKRDYQKSGRYPSYSEYIENGRESVIAPVVEGALLAMVGPVVTLNEEWEGPKSASQLEALLDELSLTTGEVIRLANDVRSFEREKTEQKINSLLILILRNGLSEKEAETEILAAATKALARLTTLSEQLPINLRKWGNYATRLAYFTKDWYMVREFHDFSLTMLKTLA
jgi:hypothetical protein